MAKAFLLLVCLVVTNLVCANDTIQVPPQQYFIDSDKHLVITNMEVAAVNSTWTNTKSYIILDELCGFTHPPAIVEIGKAYTIFVPSQNSNFTLFFTELPIISITTGHSIVDEPDVFAHLNYIASNQYSIASDIGIQFRGKWSQTLPKKSMEVEFWTDSTGEETRDYTLMNMVRDDDWNLQAMYNEPLRIRSKTNNDLWRKINTLSYLDREPEAVNGVRMKYIELFINEEYRGVYCLGEKVNRKQLKLVKHKGFIRGELYKGISWGASTFTSAPDFDNSSWTWDGFEYKYPKEEINWSNLHGLVDFVVNSCDEKFYDDYQNRFEIDNLVDYFIFLNLLRATDNTGKNVYIAKYTSDEKYFFVPWDLDGSFGTMWRGENDRTTDDLLSNGLYDRLMHDCRPGGFKEKLESKWLALRSTVITHDSLMHLFLANHEYLVANGIYEREQMAWEGYTYKEDDLNYLSSWITDRLNYLDVKFTEDCTTEEHNPICFELSYVYPNPTANLLQIDTRFSEDYTVSVINHLGQVVAQEQFDQPSTTLSLGNLNSGVYVIHVGNEEGNETHKVVLTK